jgi:phosphatidylserine/phosphatidylglycerophosphate/cardiolipin synthase-like enzyme
MAYTVDHPQVLEELEKALVRGVQVSFLVDQGTCHSATPKNQGDFLSELQDACQTSGLGEVRAYKDVARRRGVKSKGWPPALHTKAGMCDGSEAWVGSLNLTENSATYRETLVVLRCRQSVRELEEVFNRWWESSEVLDVEHMQKLREGHQARASDRRGRSTSRGRSASPEPPRSRHSGVN